MDLGRSLSRFLLLYGIVFCCIQVSNGQTLHNSGTKGEGSYYSITNCNSGTYYIHINSGWYGYSSWCSDSDAVSNLQSWCQGKSSCAFYFSNSWFGDPCGGYSKSGWVKWYCARNGGWSNWGSWSTCSLMCGSGTKYRTRSCNNPTRVSPGSDCSGSTSDTTTCNTGTCPTNQLLTNHRGPWRLVFKSPNYVQVSGYSDIYSYYISSGTTLNDNTVSVMRDFSASGSVYKSSLLNSWGTTTTVSAVRLSGYRSGAEEVYTVFNGFGKTSSTWMDCSNILDSTWTDVATETRNYCHMAATGTLKRNFFINRNYGGCTIDAGWFLLKDYGSSSGCSQFDSSSSTAPFVRYSTSTTYATWASSTTIGDSMAIFVLEWHMVFKGVQGVTSAQGYLELLWEGTSTENDDDLTTKTITKSPSKTYKSKIVENWSDAFIEQVKYAYFTSGAEKAWVVFDGRSTTKNTWFTDSKVLYSRYTDLTTSMTSDSISGDGVRAFALIRSSGACSAYTAWMFSLDNPGGSQTCSWDKNVQTRPYFLYSSGTTYSYCESGGNWNSGSFPAAEAMGIFIKGWYPVMKFARGQSVSPGSSVYNLWAGTHTLNDHDSDGQSFASSTKCYKSAIVDSWTSYYIKAVRVSFFVSGVEKAYIVFDAHGTDKTSWFNCDKILYTSYNDINRDTTVSYCSVAGQSGNERRFYLQGVSASSCDGDAGWFAVVEDSTPSCSTWESKTTKPYPMYSDTTGYELNTNMAIADVLAISIDMDNYCSTVSCLNGATCYERGVKFECVCDGTYYGTFCADRDGVWTDWTAWATCSTTCYAQGSQSRTRTCTNPSQAGSGTTCSGVSSETQTCIPDLRICSSYNTGTVAENTQYTMVCPTGYHIVVHSAFYGLASVSCSSAVAAHNLRTHCSAKTSCTFAFSDTYFTDPCNSYTKQGYATMYCRLDVQLTQPRGPWRLVFKAPASTVPTGYTDMYALFSSSSSFNDDSYNHAAMRDFSSGTAIYKSSILEDWGTTRTISAVRVSVMDNGGEAHYVIFNGFGKTKMTYWDCNDIIESSWIDMKTESHNMCTMVMNTAGYKRNFFINRAYGSCHSDTGWLFLKDYGATDQCTEYDLTSNTPYIMYSTGDTYVTFANNKQYADSLAIFVLEWHMTFKGIEGLAPTAGSLEDSWEGSTTENDNEDSVNITLTTTQNKSYKSGTVEYWSNIFIDQVKYSYFTSGTEVAYVVFDGRGTTKNTWFASAKILYSRYTDITTESKSTASISGDGTRQFALIRNSGACSAYNAWMMSLDNPSGAQTCSWDKNVKTRPYFLYSGGTSYSAPESSSAWNSAGFPAAKVMGIFTKGWFTVFKWANTQSVSPASGVYDLWSNTYTLNEFETDSFSFAANSLSYKSSIVDNWSNYYISAVRVSFYTSGTEQAYVVFDAHASTKTTWMSVSRILYSSYSDLQRNVNPSYLSVAGYTTYARRFLAQYYFYNCDGSVGWFGVMERTSGGCSFESKTTRPYPMYSDAGKAENNDNQVVAEVFAISLALEDYLPCSSSPCQNSPYNCFNRGPRFVCNCSGTYYGMACDRRDGAWTDWSAWSVCTTTCYAYGTQTRTRTCTNPTKIGVGIDCPSVNSETIQCLPEFERCPVYNTGNVAEGGTYNMICPTPTHIIVSSASYTYGGCSQADALYKLRQHCHGKTSCSITFNDALFGTTCAAYATTGSATMYCGESQMPTENRGPWKLAFRVPSGVAPTGYTDAVDLYNAAGSLNEDDMSKLIDFSSGGSYYKSSILDEWETNRSISAVRLSVFKSNKEVAYVVFDATGQGKLTWMDCSKIIDSSYKDIIYENQSICAFRDTTTSKRHFVLSRNEVSCDTSQGWLFLKDYGATSGCSSYDSTSSPTMPYIRYATDDYYITWKTGNKDYGDSLAIFVLDWDMVFKGVSGVTPSGGTLQGLWDGTNTENDADESVQTLTTTPSKTYKDKAVEDWTKSFIDIVKYSYFNGGSEVAWVRFDGRGSTKSNWFADAKILDSWYTDLSTGATATCAIAGDGTRKFAIIGTAGTCSAHKAWMMTLDTGGAQTCSWDNNVVTRPYFLYSNSTTVSFCETGGVYVSASFPTAEVMGIFTQGWFPVFKVIKSKSISSSVTNTYNMWANTFTENEYEYESFSMTDTTTNYKSSLVDNWSSHYIKAIRVSFYVSGVEKAYVVFDGHASTKITWFDCARILYTSWKDLTRDISPFACSIVGENAYSRRFYAEYQSLTCTTAYGWFGLMDAAGTTCSTWEAKATRPYAMFMDSTQYGLNSAWTVADVFTISVALDNYCDSGPCQNNATCYNRPGTFECVCNGTFYGLVCEHRDGNWTEWSAWATCSTTCWALGSHSRTRTCTNPFKVGTKGIDCSGIDGGHSSETKECIPDLPVCPSYSTGNIYETSSTNTYQMVCPLTHYTMVMTGFYGHGSCSDSWALKKLRWLCDGKINCSIPFTDTTFSNPCPSSSNYGYATLKCVEHLKVTAHRGPWHLALKVPSETKPTGFSDIASFYADSGSLNSDSVSDVNDFASSSKLVKSPLLEEWGTNRSISAVRLSVIKSNAEAAYIVFDARGKNKTDWMDCNNIIDSSWVDLAKLSQDFCRIRIEVLATELMIPSGTNSPPAAASTQWYSTDTYKRHFYVSQNDTGCTTASGWLVLKDDGATSGCSQWDLTSKTKPYIMYSTSKMAETWATGSTAFADALVLYVMEWDMVFKATEGQVPSSASSLKALWTGYTQENDKDDSYATLTTTPNKPYKSIIVDQWLQYNIEWVKYSFFSDGSEDAWVVFDGRSTEKNEWFDGAKILYSRYLDVTSLSKAVCSVAGDGTRVFAIMHDSGSSVCANVKAWMMVSDPSSPTTCSFDNTGKTKPYFIYSSNYTWSYPDASSSWSQASFPAADTMGIFIKGWFPVMKAAHGQSVSPASGIYNMWTGSHGGINEFEYDAFTYNSSSPTYRSTIIDNWSSHYIKAVRISFYKAGVEKAFVVLDGHGTQKNTWFDVSRILYTSYDNLHRHITPEYFSVAGESSANRYFFAAYDVNDCTNSYGWFGVIERTSGCSWDTFTSSPYAMYSDHTGYELMSGFAVADVFAISIAMDDYCVSAPCQMNSTCYNRETRFECICNGTFYGMVCEHRDGNWTEWTAWATCSTTCWALGSHSRTRTCTNPFPVGSKGVDCSGIDGGQASETKECIPDLPVCPIYNSGTIYETASPNTYRMVCPLTHFTMVHTASYAATGCSDASATKDARFFCDGNINCTLPFTDATFGNPCPSSSNYGSASFYCVEHMQATKHRGPWRLVFKVNDRTSPTGFNSILSFYNDSGSLNEDDLTAMNDVSSSGKLYKSSLLEEWGTNRSISAVRLSIIKSSAEVAYVVFDAQGKNKSNWMDCNNIIESSWVDIAKLSQQYCSINGNNGDPKRIFYIANNDTVCADASGWVMLKDKDATDECTNWDRVNNVPFIIYSADKMAVNWESGNKQTADALAIFVMEWDMVFKGVEGQVPTSATSLENLWKGPTQENDKDDYVSITTTPNKPFKSLIVDQWMQYFIEMVKYSYFTDGHEMAWVVFDGRSTAKNEWFDGSKIMYSNYLDIPTLTKAVAGVSGDSTRAFALIHETSGTCANIKAWMLAIDKAGGATTCSFDNTGATRPYFIYSSNYTWSYPDSGGSWSSASFPSADTMGVFIKGWFPVMKVAHGQSLSPASGIYNLWTGSHGGVNEYEYDAVSYNSSSPTYRSTILDTWSNHYVKAVRVSFYKAGVEKAFAVFDAYGASVTTWFSSSRLLYTNYNNLNRIISPSTFSIPGDSSSKRYFFAAYSLSGCTDSYGWFGVIEQNNGCGFEQLVSPRPYAFYSDQNGYELLQNTAVADVFAVSVAMDDYCASAPCQMNSTCYNRETRFECICNGTFYGMVCEHRDGNWTEWTAWATCSTTCWALGSHSRTRNCTNPFPVGTKGLDCSSIDGGHDTETKECIPDLAVCPTYNTGTIYETAKNTSYYMVCPLTHVTTVLTASYGHASCSNGAATKTLRWLCDGKINCTFSFTDSTFGSSVCPHSSNYGSAQLRCVENLQPKEHRGPWRLVFKVPSGTTPTGYTDIMSFYAAPGSLNDDSVAAMTDFSSGGTLYKSAWLDEWTVNRTISAVKIGIYKANKEEAYITFNAMGKGKMDWMDCANIIDSSWVDVAKEQTDICAMNYTADDTKRSFFVSQNETECTTANGWLVLKDIGSTAGCTEWDKHTDPLPYIMYSKDRREVTWATGNKDKADALAIYVMEWDMVFKGVQGETPAAGSLKQLWEGAFTENENEESFMTISKSPGKSFKSTIVQQWEKQNIDFVKLAHFTNGHEKAYVVFDGRSTTKSEWFAQNKILYSNYLDLPSLSKAVCSIAGDSTRVFAVIHVSGGSTCPDYKAWMMTLDSGSSVTTCSWDNNVQTRPYFLYSSNYTWSYPQTGGSWDNALFPAAETMGIFIKGWFPVMKVAHAQSFDNENITSILDLWTDTYPVNEFDYEALNYNSSSKTYKSSLVETWANHYVKAVRVSFYVAGVEKAYAVFDGHGTSKTTWFDCSKLLYTSYDNLIREITPQFCSIAGETAEYRHFYVQYETTDCNNAYGWFGVMEKSSGGCSWEQKTSPRPYALYSDHTGYELNTNMAVADVFAISVALDNYCDSNPCMNNATCYNRETRFECICNGTFYGMDCAHRDGNWTEWTPWGVCSVSCHALGTHIRTRTCSEPTTVGQGIYCPGEHWQVKECIPDLHVCPSYDSGNYTSGSTYPIVCPDTHFIIIDSAWYGNDTIGGVNITYNYTTPWTYYWTVGNDTFSEQRVNVTYYDVYFDCINEQALHDVRKYCHRKINCSVEFGSAIFGDPCPTMLKTGSVQYQCIENSILTEFRGPWRVVFKVSAGTQVAGYNDLASLYMSSAAYNEGKDSAMNDFSAGSDVYKSKILDEWHTTQAISAVRLSVFKNNTEAGFIVFDAWGKTKTNWMNCDNILDSSWYDLPRNRSDFCDFVGDDTASKRNFFVSRNQTTCDSGAGWIVVKDYGATQGCTWDTTTVSMPYIKYSPTNIYTNWTDAPYADSLAISVIDWYMAFKAVQGVSPSAAETLDVLWGGSTLENADDSSAKTVTKSPNKRVKEKIIEDWDDWVFLEWAKYSYFVGGQEVAYIMFDTRGDMHKDKFFDNSKIVLSSYSDIKDFGKEFMRVEGDGTRTFLVANDTSTCSGFMAWMFVLDDVNGATTCSFDNNVVSRPYFLYSNNGTMFPPQLSGGSWDSTGFPVAEVMGIFMKGWYPVMSVTHGQSLGNATSIYDLWTGTWTVDEWDYDGIKFTSSKTYKSSMVDNWSNQYISAVRVSFFKSAVERAYVVFDAHGSNKTSWFDCSRILYTNYVDLTRHIKALYCGIEGDSDNGKHFFIELAYNNCSDYGYFGVIENSTDGCNYTQLNSTPFAIFSDLDGYQVNYEMVVADKFQISVALRGYCDSSPCMHGATCYERAARFECICDGTYYGMICEHRDGNWTEWTPWDTCTTTCYAVGTQERYRNCTNPTTVGEGIYCPNEDWQIQDCIPALPICPEYNTGDRNDTYVMVCPWDHYISINTTWYGSVYNGTEMCSDSNAQTTLHGQCQGTINCTILFNSWFDGSSCGAYAPYGNAKMYCARDGQWTNWDPWTWCPVTCAGSRRSRNRYCTNPTQVVPGLFCPEHNWEDKDCLTDPCPVCGNHLSGYDEPYNVSVFDDLTKTGYGYLMLDVNWQIHCCEVISSWEFVPKTDGEIEFQIWRKKSNKKYEVISKVNYTVTAAEVGTTVNYSLPLKQRLAAAQWDVVGWYSPGQAMIGYAPCQGELCPIKTRRMSMSKPEVGDIVDWKTASTLKNKAYALRIYTHPNTEPFVNQTDFNALASDSSPIGTSIIAYYIQDDDIGDPLTHTFVYTADKFELNTTFDYDIHVQNTGPLPSAYTVYELILTTADTCHHTTTTTLEVTTYNAPPVLHNLPNKIELSEGTTSAIKIYDVDVKDYSDNDSVCCTLAQVIPGSLNFEIKFINEVYTLWTTEAPIFDYSGISNYYKLWVCCSDTWGVSANFLEIDIENIIEVETYIPPSWFLTAIGASMVPICFTFLLACAVLCSTFFCDAEIEYYYE